MGYKDKEKQKEFTRLWIQKRRNDFFKDKICALCGSTEKLVLHHTNPKKKESHNIWSWTQKRREAELKKCEVWCKKCHNEYHGKAKWKPISHGKAGGYDRGCRCIECKQWQSNRMKLYYKNKQEDVSQR
jgi:hypothetical protein